MSPEPVTGVYVFTEAAKTKLSRNVRRTSVPAEITEAAGAGGKYPSCLDFNNG